MKELLNDNQIIITSQLPTIENLSKFNRVIVATENEEIKNKLINTNDKMISYQFGLDKNLINGISHILYTSDLTPIHKYVAFYDVVWIDTRKWTLNIEFIISFIKQKLQKVKSNPSKQFKVIITTSASLADKLKLFFFNFKPVLWEVNDNVECALDLEDNELLAYLLLKFKAFSGIIENLIHISIKKDKAYKILERLDLIVLNQKPNQLGTLVSKIPLDIYSATFLARSTFYGKNTFLNAAKICSILKINSLLKDECTYKDFLDEYNSLNKTSLNRKDSLLLIELLMFDQEQSSCIDQDKLLQAKKYYQTLLKEDFVKLEKDKGIVEENLLKCMMLSIKDKVNYSIYTDDLYREVYGKDSIKYRYNDKILIAYGKDSNILWFTSDVNNDIYKKIIYGEEKFKIDNFELPVRHFDNNLTMIIMDNGIDIKKKCILLTADDFRYYNLEKLFSEIDHSNYLFMLNINSKLISLEKGYSYNDDESIDRYFKDKKPIYIISADLLKIKQKLEEAQQKQMTILNNLKKRFIVISGVKHCINCAYIKNTPLDLTFRDVPNIDAFEKYENLDNIISLPDPLYYVNISVDSFMHMDKPLIVDGKKILLVYQKKYTYNPFRLRELYAQKILFRQRVLAKYDKKRQRKEKERLQKLDGFMQFDDHIHPVRHRNNQYYIEISKKNINNDSYKDVEEMFTNGTKKPILFICENYQSFSLKELINLVNHRQ